MTFTHLTAIIELHNDELFFRFSRLLMETTPVLYIRSWHNTFQLGFGARDVYFLVFHFFYVLQINI